MWMLDTQQMQQAIDLSHQRFTHRRIARLLETPVSNVEQNLKGIGLGRLKHLQPKCQCARTNGRDLAT